MVEDGNLGVARAGNADEESAQADVQRRMTEARESMTDSVSEIKDAVIDQYNSARAGVTDNLDWREKVRKRPVAWSLGALGVGVLAGYGLAGLIEREDEYGDGAASERMQTPPIQDEGGGPSAFTEGHSYAAHAHAVARVGDERTDRPGVFGRFKETRAYDRLQDEVSDLGNRFMDELAHAARTIVLPSLFNKLKEIIGIDISNKRQTAKTGPRRVDERPHAAEPVAVDVPTDSAKAESSRTKGSINRFDRLASDSRTSSDQSDTGPHINLNYDDRYERESKLFSRGEDRGFGARIQNEKKPATSERRSTDSDDVPRGSDYSYEPGRDSGSTEG